MPKKCLGSGVREETLFFFGGGLGWEKKKGVFGIAGKRDFMFLIGFWVETFKYVAFFCRRGAEDSRVRA